MAKQKRSNLIFYLLFLLFFIIFIVSGILFADSLIDAKKEIETFKQLEQLVISFPESEPAASDDETEPPDPAVPEDTDQPDKTPLTNAERFAGLCSINPDFAGWLTVRGTGISYPVMNTPYAPEAYLRRDFYKKYSISGVPFFGEGCTEQSDNLIIYGHNMKNGTMFSDLLHYAEEEYYLKNPTVKFEGLNGTTEYEIFGAFYEKVHTRSEENVFRYYRYGGDLSKERFEEFVRLAKAATPYEIPVQPEYGDKLITLSTCAYHTKDGRYVLTAVSKAAQ